MSKQKFPAGWDEQRVREVLAHYESQSEDEQFAEIEAAREGLQRTFEKVDQYAAAHGVTPEEAEAAVEEAMEQVRRRRG
jgi:endonuclease V-like protein UPF0215 family